MRPRCAHVFALDRPKAKRPECSINIFETGSKSTGTSAGAYYRGKRRRAAIPPAILHEGDTAMRHWKQLFLATAALGTVLASTPACAQIEMLDYKTVGDKNIIYDAALGLEFLRLPLTYQIAQASLPTLFPGFRIARQNEVTGLLVDLGLTGLDPNGVSTYSVATGQPVMTALGALVYRDFGYGSTLQASYAYFLTAAGNYASYNISFGTGFVSPTGMSVIFQDWSASNNPYMSQRGTYLVRAAPVAPTVPEPAYWGMLIGGFGLVGAQMRRKQRQMQRKDLLAAH